jgi:hypothetical protein
MRTRIAAVIALTAGILTLTGAIAGPLYAVFGAS